MDGLLSSQSVDRIHIRPVKEADRGELLAIASLMHLESWFSNLSMSIPKVHHLIDLALNSNMAFARTFTVGREDRVCGFFMGMVQPHYFSEDLFAVDLGLYIERAHRGGGGIAAMRCIREFEEWAARKGVKEIMLGVSAGIADMKAIALYEALGYTKGAIALHKKVH